MSGPCGSDGLGSAQQARQQQCVRESAVPPASGAIDLRVGCVHVEGMCMGMRMCVCVGADPA